MTTLNERISTLIEVLGMKKIVFASHLNVSQAFISQICSGAKQPSDRTLSDICRVFNVNEDWLRTGNGEMFLPSNRKSDIAKLTMQLLDNESESFKNRLISALANLSVDEWKVLANIAEKMTQGRDTSPAPGADSLPPILSAAHERTDIEVTDEMRKHDDDIMNDDSEWE